MMNQSIVLEEPRKIAVYDSPMPVPKPNEVLLKVLYGGLCGSDLNSYRGNFAYTSYPRIPGHEFSAEIIDANGNARLEAGMIVTANPYFNCGECYSCRRKLVNCCVQNQTMGVQRDGAFSKYIAMPAERIIPGDGIDARTLALVEPFCIGYHGVKRAQVQKGERVLVIGAGTIGIFAAMAAKHCGAEVFACDVAAHKLEYAKACGIHNTIQNMSAEYLEEQTRKVTNGNYFDVTIEAVGLPATFQNCVDMSAHGGRVVVIGVSKQNCNFAYNVIQRKELKILGSRNALNADFEEVIALIKAERLDLTKVITNQYAFDDFAVAFHVLDTLSNDILKTLIAFSPEDEA